jgi:hypothetical protein
MLHCRAQVVVFSPFRGEENTNDNLRKSAQGAQAVHQGMRTSGNPANSHRRFLENPGL